MILVRDLYEGLSASGVALTIDWKTRRIACEPRGQLAPDVESAVSSNVRGLAIWYSVSRLLDPVRLPVLLDWMAAHRPSLFDAEGEGGLRLAEAWAAGRRGAFFEALDQWIAILRQACSAALSEGAALHGKIPIWCWWARYTPRGSDQSTPLSVLFEVEVGLPSDEEADILLDATGDMVNGGAS